jgi:RNA polymerase sigma-70 factor (ECF subfamily)
MRSPVGISIADPAPPSDTPELHLIAAARAGDQVAFDGLLTSRLDRTYRVARAILGNEPDARDTVQDAWLSIWRRLPSLRDPAAFDGWVDRIVVNACRSRLRDRARIREIPMADGFEQPDRSHGARPEDVAEREAVERAFERLTADQRAILVLHHLQHRSVVEIAAALGIPEGTVKWRLHAARTALSAAMEADR